MTCDLRSVVCDLQFRSVISDHIMFSGACAVSPTPSTTLSLQRLLKTYLPRAPYSFSVCRASCARVVTVVVVMVYCNAYQGMGQGQLRGCHPMHDQVRCKHSNAPGRSEHSTPHTNDGSSSAIDNTPHYLTSSLFSTTDSIALVGCACIF